MKGKIFNIEGKEKGKIQLPSCFSSEIREDVVAKFLQSMKTWQPYGPSLIAGKQVSAKGKIRHRRHVWKTHYGRGWSRVPRKIMSRRGDQITWEAAEVPQAKGGMRAHPPKVLSMPNTKKINKKEAKLALISAISASANASKIAKRYENIEEKDLKEVPLIIEEKITSLKAKEFLKTLKNMLGEKLFKLALKKKSQRPGKGKLRGRKYKKSAGLLIVIGDKEKLKTKNFDVVSVKNLGVNDLANGGLGRLTLYTENAIKYLEGYFK